MITFCSPTPSLISRSYVRLLNHFYAFYSHILTASFCIMPSMTLGYIPQVSAYKNAKGGTRLSITHPVDFTVHTAVSIAIFLHLL